jgi:hypothetical protein
LADEQIALDLMDEDGARPAMFDGLLGIPGAFFGRLHGIEQADVMAPGQLCNDPLHNFGIGPGNGQGPHIFEVSRRKPGHFGERLTEIPGQPVDDLGAPTLTLLPGENIPPDGPVEHDHLAVDRQAGAVPGFDDPLL